MILAYSLTVYYVYLGHNEESHPRKRVAFLLVSYS